MLIETPAVSCCVTPLGSTINMLVNTVCWAKVCHLVPLDAFHQLLNC